MCGRFTYIWLMFLWLKKHGVFGYVVSTLYQVRVRKNTEDLLVEKKFQELLTLVTSGTVSVTEALKPWNLSLLASWISRFFFWVFQCFVWRSERLIYWIYPPPSNSDK